MVNRHLLHANDHRRVANVLLNKSTGIDVSLKWIGSSIAGLHQYSYAFLDQFPHLVVGRRKVRTFSIETLML